MDERVSKLSSVNGTLNIRTVFSLKSLTLRVFILTAGLSQGPNSLYTLNESVPFQFKRDLICKPETNDLGGSIDSTGWEPLKEDR